MSAPDTSKANLASMRDGEGILRKETATKSINTCNAKPSYTNQFAAHLCCSLIPRLSLREPGYGANLCCELEYVHKIKMAYNREEVSGRGS